MRRLVVLVAIFVGFAFAKDISLPALNNAGKSLSVSIEDKKIKFKDYPNKYIILEFFGYRCPTCFYETSHLKIMQKDNPFVKVVAVHMDTLPNDRLDDYIFENGINYPVVPFTYAYDLDKFARYVEPRWGGMIPFMMLINTEGKVLNTFLGITTEEDIMKYINRDKMN